MEAIRYDNDKRNIEVEILRFPSHFPMDHFVCFPWQLLPGMSAQPHSTPNHILLGKETKDASNYLEKEFSGRPNLLWYVNITSQRKLGDT